MIDLTKEVLITLAQAARLLPKPPSPCTFWRWRTRGINGVRLECLRSGGRWLTTQQSLERFLIAQTQATSMTVPSLQPTSDSSARLRAAGLLPKE